MLISTRDGENTKPLVIALLLQNALQIKNGQKETLMDCSRRKYYFIYNKKICSVPSAMIGSIFNAFLNKIETSVITFEQIKLERISIELDY